MDKSPKVQKDTVKIKSLSTPPVFPLPPYNPSYYYHVRGREGEGEGVGGGKGRGRERERGGGRERERDSSF